MKICELYEKAKMGHRALISLEIFPPKKEVGLQNLEEMLQDISIGKKPDYISVTYGAFGSTKENRTLEIASEIKKKYGIESLHHLTSVGSSKEEVHALLQKMKEKDIKNILALRGDNPLQNKTNMQTDYHYAKDLIQDIDTYGQKSFCIGAATYPEGHIDCLSSRENITHLKEKEEGGAGFFISQLFFENRSFYTLLDDCRRARIHVPISAGIMPILSKNQVEKMIFMCGVTLPTSLIKIIHKYEHCAKDLQKAGLEYAMNQARELIDSGVDGIHFYTMNRTQVATRVLDEFL